MWGHALCVMSPVSPVGYVVCIALCVMSPVSPVGYVVCIALCVMSPVSPVGYVGVCFVCHVPTLSDEMGPVYQCIETPTLTICPQVAFLSCAGMFNILVHNLSCCTN